VRKSKLILIFFPIVITMGCNGCEFGENPLGPSGFGGGNIKYYGYYFVEDEAKHLYHLDEVRNFTNIINMRYDNGANNEWDKNIAARVRASDVKVMLQIPFGDERDQTTFTDFEARRKYLQKVKQDMLSTGFMSSIAYIAISEEWYVLISQGHYDSWPIFQGKSPSEKFAIAQEYLEYIISDINTIFPNIPTVIVENILPFPPPPANIDVIGVDAYYIPTSSECNEEQQSIFNGQVLPYYNAASVYDRPIMMVAPSFVSGPWKMLSECQMQWYADLAVSGKYNIESFLWFLYNYDTNDIAGVRNSPDLIAYQRKIACQLINKCIN
jgi:hypothetical protein